jgi:lipoyl(octanoyl) transferase
MNKEIIWDISKEPVLYEEAVEGMEDYVDKIHKEDKKDKIWMLEHQDVYTAGVSSNFNDLINKNIKLIKTGRGGKLTYHGLGMRIIYVMLNLKQRNMCDVRKYIFNLEQVIINSLAYFSIIGERRVDRVGIWVVNDQGYEDKIAAIGVRIRKWVSFHGLAINIKPNLDNFNNIVPCGINQSNYGVTSLEKLGVEVAYEDFDKIFQQEFLQIFTN